jgi:hypothetical protein
MTYADAGTRLGINAEAVRRRAALIGFILGKSFSWPAIAAFSIGLAVLSAVVLQRQVLMPRQGSRLASLA